MKKLFNQIKGKYGVVTLMNLFALLMVFSNVNVTCAWAHYQPEVPEIAQKFKKL